MAAPLPAVRRLAAIVIADVVGFSRHMERDDAGTLARLRSLREDVVDPALVRNAGHVVKTAGDGMLIEFGSADAALRFAVELQRALAERNAALGENERIEYRIGINLGDIIVDGTDIAGDGVNVASRLEALAAPGGICVSSAVREQVHGNLAVSFDDIGDQQVKNIMRPIRVYQVRMEGAAAPAVHAVAAPRARPRLRWPLTAVAAVLAACAAGVLWLKPWNAPAPSIATAPALSIAILPFSVVAAGEGDRALGDALGDELGGDFSQARWYKVVARGMTPESMTRPLDAHALGARLNVRYLLDGEIKRVGDGLQLTTRLVDAATSSQVWSDRFEFPPHEPGLDPRVVGEVFQHTRIGLYDAEVHRAVREQASATPMDLVLRGDGIATGPWTRESALAAGKLYEAALQREPGFVPALVGVAGTMDDELEDNAAADHASLGARMDDITSRAIRLDAGDPAAWIMRAYALTWLGRWDEAWSATQRAVSLQPSNRLYVLHLGWIRLRTGHPSEALKLFEQALAMDPRRDAWPLHFMCKAQLFLGRYAEAAASCESAAALNNGWINQLYLCAAYAQNGDSAKAAVAKAALLEKKPGYTISVYRQTYANSPPAFFDLVDRHLAAGLRKAGIADR